MDEPLPDLDAFLPHPAVRTRHARTAAADADALWRAASEVRLTDTRTLGRVVRWRIPGTAAGQTYDAMFRGYPFTLLDEGPRHSVSGLCGRIWTLARRRIAAAWSTGWTRASLHSSAVPSPCGRAQWPKSTRTVPGSAHAANSSGPASAG